MHHLSPIQVIDSRTEGEPTRVVITGGPDLGSGPIAERLRRFQTTFDPLRSGVVCAPRGSEVVVGALLLEPVKPDSSVAVILLDVVGFLRMCGHETIRVIESIAYLGTIVAGPSSLFFEEDDPFAHGVGF